MPPPPSFAADGTVYDDTALALTLEAAQLPVNRTT